MIWPKVAEWISAALAHGGGGYTIEDIYEALLCRGMSLWLIGGDTLKACAVTRLCTQPRLNLCELIAVGGEDVASWEHLIVNLEEWAKSVGCQEMRPYGRLGWKVHAKRYGYEPLCVVYRKRLQ